MDLRFVLFLPFVLVLFKFSRLLGEFGVDGFRGFDV